MNCKQRGEDSMREEKPPSPALLSFLCGGMSIAVLATLATVTHTIFIFPSLGPSAFLFFAMPLSPAASPRNAITGHAIGGGVGYFSLVLTGLTHAGPALTTDVSVPRVIGVSIALATTCSLMVVLHVPHPPAAATTLLVALGILPHPEQLFVVMLAVLLLTAQAWIFNRLVGIPYPLWNLPRLVSIPDPPWNLPRQMSSSNGDHDPGPLLDARMHGDFRGQAALEEALDATPVWEGRVTRKQVSPVAQRRYARRTRKLGM
jgi:CBS domain-containing membrane protein